MSETFYSIYDFPDAYDALMQRPAGALDAETMSIEKLMAQHGVDKARILDMGCGRGAHALRLAKRGHSVTGLDKSERMLAAARVDAKRAKLEVPFVQGDLLEFSMGVNPFDCAIFMYETFPTITEIDDIRRHFQSVRLHLRKGGIYIIDIDAGCKRGVGLKQEIIAEKSAEWEGGRAALRSEAMPGDWVKNTSHIVTRCNIRIADKVYRTRDEWRCRCDSPWNLEVLAGTLDEWTFEGFYSWRDLSRDIQNEDHYFMVLKRASGRSHTVRQGGVTLRG